MTTPRAALALTIIGSLVAGPARADKSALLIGNSLYETKCSVSLPTVPNDVALMSAALGNAMYAVSSTADRNRIEMLTDVESLVPPDPDEYVVYYSGLGEPLVAGALVGPDCTRLSPDDLIAALGDAAARTLLILDSCASGAYADSVNALDSRICTITAATGTDCVTPGVFTPCFVDGLNGAADTSGDGVVTVAEAAAHAVANCGDGATTPTWDGDCPDRMVGMGPVALEARSWGSGKADYR